MYFYKKCFILLVFLIFCNSKSNIIDVRILQAPDGRIFIFLGDAHIRHYSDGFKELFEQYYQEKILFESDYKRLVDLQSQLNEKIKKLEHLQSQQIINFIKKFQKILSTFIELTGEQETIMDLIAENLDKNDIRFTNLEIRKNVESLPIINYLSYIKNLDLKNTILNNYYAKIIQKYESVIQNILQNKQKNKNVSIVLANYQNEMINLSSKIFDKNSIYHLKNSKNFLNLTIAGAGHCKLISQQLIGAYKFKEIFYFVTENIQDDITFFGILYRLFLANKYDKLRGLFSDFIKQYETFEKIDLQKLLEQHLPKNLQIKSKL